MVKNIWGNVKLKVAAMIALTRIQRKFPTCIFHQGANIDMRSTFGKHNVIFSNVSINNSEIADHTFIQKNSSVNSAMIGRFCSIAMGVNIGLGQHPLNCVSTHPAFYSNTQPLAKTYSEKDTFEPFRQTIIGHDVWIGQNALIMDGVNIGTGSIIAAGSVVTKNIEPYAIAAGVPAKIIRYRFDEDLRQKLIQTEWWNKSEDWLQKNYSLFFDPVKLIESYKD